MNKSLLCILWLLSTNIIDAPARGLEVITTNKATRAYPNPSATGPGSKRSNTAVDPTYAKYPVSAKISNAGIRTRTYQAPGVPVDPITLDGVRQYVNIPNNNVLEFATGTIEMWVKPDWSSAAANLCLISERQGSTRYSFHINNNLGAIGLWNGSNYNTVSYTFTRGQWYHIAFVMTSSNTEIFINGNSIGKTNNVINTGVRGLPIKIGASETSGSEFFKGSIDEVRIWNVVRSQADIAANMNASVNSGSSGLIAYYPIDANVTGESNRQTGVLKDYSTNKFDGNILNYWAPIVSTSAVTVQTTTTATLGGTVATDAGAAGSSRGVVFGTTADPTIGGSGVTQNANGAGAGVFSKLIAGLTEGTTYHVRAYAYNSVGTAYGDDVQFSTASRATVSSIVRAGPNPTNASTVQYIATFDRSITGITTSNFLITPSGLPGAGVASVSGSGTTYTVTVNTGTGSGNLALNLANDLGITPSISTSLPYAGETYTIDKTAPTTSIASLALSADNGASSSDFITNTASQTISGTLSANLQTGESVLVSADNGGTYNIASASVGSNAFSLSGVTLSGNNTIVVRVQDAAGNMGAARSQSYIIDTTAPSAPVVLTVANGAMINTSTPIYSGTAEANANVIIYIDNGSIGSTTANGSGLWSYTQPAALPAGTHTAKATATDLAGNTSAYSNTNTYTIDTSPPVAPLVSNPANGGVTNNDQPTYTGTAEANSTVTIYVDATSIGTTGVNSSGNWSLAQPTRLSSGSHTFYAKATDLANNTSPASSTNTFVVDTTSPAISNETIPANGTYKVGDILTFTLTMSEPVIVTGAIRIPLAVGFPIRYANYDAANSTSTALKFNYTVLSGDQDYNGITSANTVDLNQGSVKDDAGNNANLTLPYSNVLAGVNVDGVAPTVTSVTVPANGTYTSGQDLDLKINYSENVVVNTAGGTPSIVLQLDEGRTVHAYYVSGSNSNSLTFRYTVQSTDKDSNGILVGAVVLTDGGTIKDVPGNNANNTLNNVGSTASVLVDGTPILPQTITFTAIPVRTYGDADFDPGATSDNSGITITYTSSNTNVATIVNGKIHMVASGTSTITASQTGDATHSGAADKQQMLTVNAKRITVTADAKTKTYGDAEPALTYQISSGALVGADSFTGSLTRAAGENVGTYAITQGSLVLSNNYALTYVGTNMAIGTRSVTVTADAKVKTYGEADPALTYQITSGALVGADSFTGSLTRTAGENVGTYTINQGSLALSNNYSLTYVGANLTIGKKTMTVTADAKTKTYGEADPALTYQITSGALVGADSFTGNLTRTAGENVGTYTINQGALALSDNYSLTYAGANLTIGKKTMTVTADAKTKTYGEADPALTYQITSGALVGADSFTGNLTRTAGENVGTYTINQGALALSDNYSLTYAGANLTIGKKTMTVTADAKTKTYGEADPALTYQVTSGALVGADSFTGSLTRTAGENVGTYAINKGSLALSNNYSLSYVGANLTIGTRTITVTADAKTKNYGDADPALTYQITSGALVGADSFTGKLTRAAGENIGTYKITQGSLALSDNYALTYVGTNLTIGTRSVTVTADAKIKTYGDTDPALTYKVTSGALVGADSFTGSLTRVTGENVGVYAIMQGTLSLSNNYTLNFSGANLAIGAKAITVIADTKTKTYGEADPALTYTFDPALAAGDSFAGSLTRAAGENAGTYPILQGTLALNNNYTLNFKSADLVIGKRNITLTADTKSKVYGTADPALTYTTSPSLISGDTFSGSLTRNAGENVGTYAITQGTLSPGNNYIVTYNGANLNITPAMITGVNLAAASFTYDGTAKQLVVSGSLSGATVTYIGNGQKDAGVYTVQAVLERANYNKLTLSAPLTILKAPLTITANDNSRVFGVPDPIFTAVYSGFVNGEGLADLLARPLLTTTATITSPVGRYAITAAGASSDNYSFKYVNGTLTVTTSSSAQISFPSLATRTYLDPDFNPGATNAVGETLVLTSSNTSVATIVNGRVRIVGAGRASITAAFPSTSNYSASPSVSQLLIVNKAPQTIELAAVPDLTRGSTYTITQPTASSGLPVTLVSADPAIASLSGSVLTANRIGYTSITAYQNGNDNYLPASTVTRAFEVNNDPGKLAVEVHQALSPNGDGINDVWVIEGINKYPGNVVTVYNRNGVKIYEVRNYDNVNNVFNGRSNINGQLQLAGTYYYTIQFQVNGKGQRSSGYFVLKYQ